MFRSARAATRAARRAAGTRSSLIKSTPSLASDVASPSLAQRSIRSISTTRTSSSPQTAWAEATESAHSILTPPTANSPSQDPLEAIYSEISTLRSSLFSMLGSSHPSLDKVAKYYFQAEGKHLRPLLVLLLSQATNGLAGSDSWERARHEAQRRNVDDSLTSRGGVLNDWNPEQMGKEDQQSNPGAVFANPFSITPSNRSTPSSISSTASTEASSNASTSSLSDIFNSMLPSSSSYTVPLPPSLQSSPLSSLYSSPGTPEILSTQRRLASITEMIHVASLLHDDVIDNSALRRNLPSAPSAFGSKLSILSGDFLLGRASVALSRLGSNEVVELLATVIANLVEGEVLQLRATSSNESTIEWDRMFEEYMRKTYLKTASLMSKSCRAAVILGGCGRDIESEWVKDVAYGYGRNLGIAFQLVDDALDFIPASDMGKPSDGADLSLGLATAPALFAYKQNPALGPLILRKFEGEGDVQAAKKMIMESDGVKETINLAKKFANSAKDLIELLPESEARGALVGLTKKVVERVK